VGAASALTVVQAPPQTLSATRTAQYGTPARLLDGGHVDSRTRPPRFQTPQEEIVIEAPDRRSPGISGRRGDDRGPAVEERWQRADPAAPYRVSAGNFGGFSRFSIPFLAQVIAQQVMPYDDRAVPGYAAAATTSYRTAARIDGEVVGRRAPQRAAA
jgi:hypothetical protein